MSFSSDIPLQSNQLPISLDTPGGLNLTETINLLFKRISNTMNTKEGALYLPIELATFQSYFTPNDPQRLRNTYRMVVDFGALPNAGTKTVPHGIAFDSNFTLTRLYGAATDSIGLTYIPLPLVAIIPNNGVQLFLDSTNVIISTGTNRTNYTRSTVVIEYMKNL